MDDRDQCVSLPGTPSSVATITSSTWSSRIDGGRPGRCSSCRPSRRLAMNRARHRSTVDSSTPRSAAASLFVPPSAQRSTIFARTARYWAVFARLAHRISWARSASVKTSPAFCRPPARHLQPRQAIRGDWRRHLDTDLTATPSACAAPAFDIPPAHAKMIRARSARQRPGTPARRSNSARSSSDSTIRAAEGPECDTPSSLAEITLRTSDAAHSAVTANVGRVDHAAVGLGRPQRCWRSLRIRARSRRWAARTAGWRALALRQLRQSCRRRASTVWFG